VLKRGPGERWVVFAGVVLMLAGAFNVIDGTVALVKEDYFRDELLFADTSLWGTVVLITGLLQVAAGFGVLARATWGILLGIGFVFLNSLVQLAWFAHFPLWSGAILVLDLFLLYALMVPATAED
jgi:hypothetical protein